MQTFYTIGMAGHIDHGKTTLTKVLTGVDTDRLKEEKLRSISIEPGFAPLVQTDEMQISLIDVPGHEKFIRQMIAGVAGIDFVVLVIAADEGIMPQTEEHLAILSLLGIKDGLVAVTKIDQVEADFLELVVNDIQSHVTGTFLEKAPIHFVDSISGKGIAELKQALLERVSLVKKRITQPAFRLPIDHVFTVKGQGTVVRGTIYDGDVHVGDQLLVLPRKQEVRVRQIESHHEQVDGAYAGQRAALNISGITHDKLKRGDVLVSDDFYTQTKRMDVALTTLHSMNHPLKQRQPIKVYVGTAEVMGKIIFFDRNELTGEEGEILCQLELYEEVVLTRGDTFILRRATPPETLGGGWIIEPKAEKYRFGEKTIARLEAKHVGSAEERVMTILQEKYLLSKTDILKETAITEADFREIADSFVCISPNMFTLKRIVEQVQDRINVLVSSYHEKFPLRQGINKAEMMSELTAKYPQHLVTYVLEYMQQTGELRIRDQYIALTTFVPHIPPAWEKRVEQAIRQWEAQAAKIEPCEVYLEKHQIPANLQSEIYYFLIHTGRAHPFDENRLMPVKEAEALREKLYAETGGQAFTLQTARDILQLSRKNLVPLLELYDQLGYTKRKKNERVWLD